MDDRRSVVTAGLFVLVIGAIVGSAFATRAFDNFYYGPLCRQYAEETGLEFVSVGGGTRRSRLHCTFMLYNDDGTVRAVVDVPVGRIQAGPLNFLVGNVRTALLIVIIVPAVWLARQFSDDD
jgi:hypothetical protein